MKSLLTFNSMTKKSALFTALLGTAVFFNSCKNDIDTATPAIAALSVVNAYPSNDALSFYIGGQQVNNTGIAFGQHLNYFQAYEGARGMDVSIAGSQTSLFNKSITLKGGIYHSLYITGATAATLDYVLLEDNTSAPAANKAKIRFINLSPDAPALKLELAGDTTAFSNLAFKANTPFKTVNAAKSNFVLKNQQSNQIVASLDSVNLENGKVYSVWAKGLASSTTVPTKISIQVTKH